jgi:hypothetical protein
MIWKPKDIKEFMLQDQARGKRHRADPEKIEERKRIRQDMRDLLKIEDKATFLRTLIIDYELQVDSEEYRRALKAWQEQHP